MSSGKKKKSSKKPAPGTSLLPIVLGAVLGLVIVGGLIWGAMTVLGQRKTVSDYQASVTKITEALKTRDPESPAGALKLSEIEALVTGTPTVTRETLEKSEYAVYTWSGGASPVGFRLKLEKNGSLEEVAELVTLGAQ